MRYPEKRDAIMQAALELIAERGFHGAPMSEIAANAGVAAGTIYRYFENKDILINELAKELKEGINESLLQGYPAERPLRERFLYCLRKLFQHFVENPCHFNYMEKYFNSPYGVSKRRDKALGKSENNDMILEIFDEGIKQQIIKDLPVPALFSLAFGPMISLVRDHILGFIILDEHLISRIVEACWDSVKR